MTLATKNGSLIVKDGSLAENCGCCGGWYCCAEPACFSGRITGVSATLTVDDYLQQSRFDYTSGFEGSTHFSSAIAGSAMSRQYTLTADANGTAWSYTAADCRDATISFSIQTIVLSGITQYQAQGTAMIPVLGYYSENDAEYKTAAQMQCANACTGSLAVRSAVGQPYRNGTYKCSTVAQEQVSAFKLLGQCELPAVVVESSPASVSPIAPHPQYYFQSPEQYTRTSTIVFWPEPLIALASVRFEVAIS